MHTRIRRFLIVLSVLFSNVFITETKGQDTTVNFYPQIVSIPSLKVSNEQIISLLDSVYYYWENSFLNGILSYATLVPHIKQDNRIIWHIRIEQLYDYDVFSLNFPNVALEYVNLFIPYGLLYLNKRLVFVGVDKRRNIGDEDVSSRRIVESYFITNTDNITFMRDNVELQINQTNYLRQTDTIKSDYPFPESFIYDSFDAIELYFIETEESFSLLKKKVVKIH